MKHVILLFIGLTLSSFHINAQTKILFDATKAETAGQADWVIDADSTNLNWTNTSTVTRTGKKANAQRFPTPDQSSVTTSTPETYWTGSLSSWGIDCVNKGYHVESLPFYGRITYGDTTNPQDLSNYKVYVVDEPNIYFTASEKTAMMNFVANGGGLFIISDHSGSDRNNDGSDSPTIWDDFFTNNGVANNPFGINFFNTNPNVKTFPADFSETTNNFTKETNPISKGPCGTATEMKYSDGTSILLDTIANPTVKGVAFANESTSIINGVMFAYAKYGKGKIVATGDSSPCDDGTGSKGYSSLYVSYANEPTVGNNHRYLFMNSTIWLATTDTALPVKFISITGNNKNNVTTLFWQVSAPSSAEYYQVEKSIDGTNYSVVTTTQKRNNENGSLENYQWQTQEHTTTTSYYRIKAIESNCILDYSQVISIAPENKQHIRVYPNPVNATGSFTISGLNTGSIITITDAKGSVYYQSTAITSSITFNSSNSKMQRMAPGVYIVAIKDAGTVLTEKLMINK